MSRKDFIINMFKLTLFLFSSKKLRAAELKPVEPGHGIAKVLVYYTNHELAIKDPKSNMKEKDSILWKDQICKNCKHYNVNYDSTGAGVCALIPGYLVKEEGICNSWRLNN